MAYQLEFSSHLDASPSEMWAWITSFEGICKEMAPYLRMSVPASVKSLSSNAVEIDRPLFRSWIKILGVIPFDYSDLTLKSLEDGVGFVEESPMGSMRLWRHARTISPADTGCFLTDKLTFEPRVAGWMAHRIVNAFFKHRHRMLEKYLGKVASA